MFDLFGTVPSQQVEHHGIRTGVLEPLVLDDPLSENGGEMFDRGDISEATVQPPSLEGLGPVWLRAADPG
jgi:hypothetical protein